MNRTKRKENTRLTITETLPILGGNKRTKKKNKDTKCKREDNKLIHKFVETTISNRTHTISIKNKPETTPQGQYLPYTNKTLSLTTIKAFQYH